jgi:hypothetical protein
LRVSGGSFFTRVKLTVFNSSDGVHMLGKLVNMGNAMIVQAGQVIVTALRARFIESKSLTQGNEGKGGAPVHPGHVSVSQDINTDMPDTSAAIASAMQGMPPGASTSAEERVRPIADYLPNFEYPTEDTPQSLAQQLAASGDHPAQMTFEAWDFATDADKGDPDAVNVFPWPGRGAQMTAYTSEAVLHKPSQAQPSTFTPNGGDSSVTAAGFQCWTSDAQ